MISKGPSSAGPRPLRPVQGRSEGRSKACSPRLEALAGLVIIQRFGQGGDQFILALIEAGPLESGLKSGLGAFVHPGHGSEFGVAADPGPRDD